jgi:hypothetical protein
MMKFRQAAEGEALCPVCALDGIVAELSMAPESLQVHCGFGHTIDMITLSKLAGTYGTAPEISPQAD